MADMKDQFNAIANALANANPLSGVPPAITGPNPTYYNDGAGAGMQYDHAGQLQMRRMNDPNQFNYAMRPQDVQKFGFAPVISNPLDSGRLDTPRQTNIFNPKLFPGQDL